MREYIQGYMAKEADYTGTITGLGLGGVAGGLLSDRKKLLRDIILGSAIGGTAGFVFDQMKAPGPIKAEDAPSPRELAFRDISGGTDYLADSIEREQATNTHLANKAEARAAELEAAGEKGEANKFRRHASKIRERDPAGEAVEAWRNTEGPGIVSTWSNPPRDWRGTTQRVLDPFTAFKTGYDRGVVSPPDTSLSGVLAALNPMHGVGRLTGTGMRASGKTLDILGRLIVPSLYSDEDVLLKGR